jgi:hypothetical protein
MVHKLAGSSYAATLVYPEIASLVFEYISQHNPEEFYPEHLKQLEDFPAKR